MESYIVNQTKQIGIAEAEGPEDAVRQALSGEGTVISVNFSASPRPKAMGMVTQVTTPAVVHKGS